MPDDSDLVDLIKAKANVLLLQPADILVLSNADGLTDAAGVVELIERMRDDLGVSQVYVFKQDVDFSVLRPTAADTLADLDQHLRIGGDENGGVTIGCATCDHDGDWYGHLVAHHGHSGPADVPEVHSLAALFTAAVEHVRTVHSEVL